MRRIRNRLVLAFLVVALLPAIPLSFIVHGLLERSFMSGTGDPIGLGLTAGLDESRARLRAAKADFLSEAEEHWIPHVRSGEIEADLGRFRESGGGETLVRFLDESSRKEERTPGGEWALIEWAREQHVPPVGGKGEPERFGGYLALVVAVGGDRVALIARPLDPEMVEHAGRIMEAVGFFESLRVVRVAILRSYVVPFVLVYAFLILIAVGFGALLARRIARPLESLVRSTRRVADGDLEARVSVSGRGETRELEESFNRMVGRLASQRAEMARLERKAAWRDMARSLAHEIKNPLTPIQLAVQEIRDRFTGTDEEYRRFLGEAVEIVDEEIQALRKLVREFSEFARLPEPKPVPDDLTSTLDELARLYGEEALRVHHPADGVIGRIDTDEIRRVLINLIDNGLAACRAAGRAECVEIRAASDEGRIRIDVTDNGCGIGAESLERIFEPNYSTKSGGMGLGLPIVEGIVNAHGGSIDVRSEQGKGTVFRILLPAEGPERGQS